MHAHRGGAAEEAPGGRGQDQRVLEVDEAGKIVQAVAEQFRGYEPKNKVSGDRNYGSDGARKWVDAQAIEIQFNK